MKKAAFFSVSLFLCISLFSKPLHWNETASLYDHLVEVNAEWLKMSVDEFLCKEMIFENDQQRIQMHLRLVEQYLRQDPSLDFNEKQLNKRSVALNILNTYWKAGTFPQNTFHKQRQPYFKDTYGTTCAVGYLVLKSGNKSLVEHISKEMNYGYLSELKDHFPALLNWAEEFGFTVDELAWIQPAYYPAHSLWYKVGNGGGVEGHINVMEARFNNSDFLYLAGDFSEIDGIPANSIIAWDGETWNTMGNGVSGEIFDLEITPTERVIIVGDFYVNDDPDIQNAAYWENGNWYPVTDQLIEGVVFTVHYQSTIFIGGDFSISTDSGIIENMAYKRYNEDYWSNQDGAFSVNGIVRDFYYHQSNLLVAGSFSETGIGSSDTSVTNLNVNGLAYWDPGNTVAQIPGNWNFGFYPMLPPSIYSATVFDGWLVVGSDIFNEDYYYLNMGKLAAGIWDYTGIGTFNYEDTCFIDFIEYEDCLFAYGNIGSFGGLVSTGILPYVGSCDFNSRAEINGAVRAAERFRDFLYVAGDFTHIKNEAFSGLAYTAFELPTSVDEIEDKTTCNVFTSIAGIHIEGRDLRSEADFHFFDLNGRLLYSEHLVPGSGEKLISTQNWPAGMYVYQIISDGTWKSGKLVIF